MAKSTGKNKDKKEPNLKQTKGHFKVAGNVVGLDKDNAYRDGTVENGKMAGSDYRSIRFGVQTNEGNTVYVEMFGMELDEVYVHPSDKDSKEKGIKIPFAKRNKVPEGYNIISTSVSLERDAKGHLVRENLVEFDAVELIHEKLEDGMSVFVTGDLVFSKYTNPNNNETRTQSKYVIKSLSVQKNEIDFSSEKFEEVSSFDQEVVVESVEIDKESNTVNIDAYVINYGEKFEIVSFVVDAVKNPKLANSVYKNLKPMDFIKLYGVVLNGVEFIEGENEEEEDDWGSEKPAGYNRPARRSVKLLRVTGVDAESHTKKMYKDEDFTDAAPEEESPFKKSNKEKQSQTLGDDDEDDVPF